MTYRPHPLRQSHTLDYASVTRNPSTTSSASSGYSYSSDHSRGTLYSTTSTDLSPVSATASPPSASAHRRGKSDVSRLTRSKTFDVADASDNKKPGAAKDLYQNMRQSLRPPPPAPASGPPPPQQPRPSLRHDRGQSLDISRLSLSRTITADPITASPTSPPAVSTRVSALRPTSMYVGRGDVSNRGSAAIPHAHSPAADPVVHTTTLAKPDLASLGRSTTSQLRTLSQFAKEQSEGFINTPAQEVTGLRGRRRLQRVDQKHKFTGYGNWMDKQRQFLQAYEYLCHIGEAKEWIEDIINKTLPPIVELEEALRNGVTLAEVVESLNPDRKFRIFHHARLQYRHSDNIAIFFRYLDEVELPDLFRFELIDLYEKKNIPKVIYCIHALSWLLFRNGIVNFRIGNLVGQLTFEDHELEAMQKGLDQLGASMPSFGNMGADFGVEPEPELEPEETEEERVERELAENETSIVELQTQMRGALVRLRLGHLMQDLWSSEHRIIDLQSRIRGDWTRQIMNYRMQMRRFASGLQSAARGFLVRKRMQGSQRFWKSAEPDILDLQSIARANKARNKVRQAQAELQTVGQGVPHLQAAVRGFLLRQRVAAQVEETATTEEPVKALQAAIRGMLTRDRVGGHQELVRRETPAIAELQAAIRGMLTRDRVGGDKELLRRETPVIAELQAAARAVLTRSQVSDEQQMLREFESQWAALQAAARGGFVRAAADALRTEAKANEPAVVDLQSIIRANAMRRNIAARLGELTRNEEAIAQLQSLSRGMLQRNGVVADQALLEDATPDVVSLQSHIRGYLFRQQQHLLLSDLYSHGAEIEALQAIARAMAVRVQVGDTIAQLEVVEDSVIELQSLARGMLVRADFAEKKRFFDENMSKVVKIQSFVRAKLQGEAYKSLTAGKNPPVNAVKNFVHLLNDSDFDFNEEVEFERMRKTVVQQVRQNEMLEQYIDQLDIKIALLVKNKITLDEVVRHQHNFGGHSVALLANSSMSSANQFDLKALNKGSRKKLESYQQLFFNLQTQPQYLARLFRRIREQGTPEKECKRVELLMMSLFGYAQKRREEYYLLKLISRSIREEAESSVQLDEYLRGNFFWSKLLSNHTRSPRDRKFLRDLLSPLIRDEIIEHPELDLETDPMQIYRAAINNEELMTGRPSRRPLDVPRQVALKDDETRDLYIRNLQALREIMHTFLDLLGQMIQHMPYGLRYVCQQMFEALTQQFRREHPDNISRAVSHWLWRFYLQPALTAPESLGVIERQLSPLQKRNLTTIANVLNHVALGRPFGADNIFLHPLHGDVEHATGRLNMILRNIMAVPDAETRFDIDEFNDLYAKNKPTLYIKMTDIFAIHNLAAAEIQTMCPSRDDVLREIMHELGSAKNNEHEMTAAGSSDIQMYLTPKLHDVEDPEADVKSLFMETKRAVLYIIRVQTGTNLYEILLKPVTEEDEYKWQMLLRDDFADGSNTRGAYSDANMVDVARMSYHDLKRNALENVMRLEQLGRITRHNQYQDVLNAIALDIRTKSRRRVQRQREVDGVRLTLSNLHEKAKYLEQQRKSYDDYIEQAMSTLQNKKGRRRFLMPFTKQYNHQRELERSGRVPKFGSFKYSARALSEKGVLVSWNGVGDWEKINVTISCDEVGIFSIEGSRGHIQMPGASALVPIEDLLQAQFEAHQFMNLFEGNMKLNVNLLLHLLYKKFYRTQ